MSKEGLRCSFFTPFGFGLLIGIVLGMILGFGLHSWLYKSPTPTTITKTVVLERIQEQAFLVTRTVITDQDVTINIDQGSGWSNFWWGHEITAQSRIQVDVGVDLGIIAPEDVEVDDSTKQIKIRLPEATVYNTSLVSDIRVTTKSGILKKILEKNTDEDYNIAMRQLCDEAELTIAQNEILLDEAKQGAISILESIFADTEYTIVQI